MPLGASLASVSTAPAVAAEDPPLAVSSGWCRRCAQIHSLPSFPALAAGRALMDQLRGQQRLDFTLPLAMADPRCRTDELFGPGGGKMFGVLCCRDPQGRPVVLRAFSGQYNGCWQVEGWVGPLFDVAIFDQLIRQPEQEIKRLGREIAGHPLATEERRRLQHQRRALSQALMRHIHGLYRLNNFRGETASLAHAFIGTGAPPAGTGDCCGPKLLRHAATHGLVPEGLAEFYWGRANGSATRAHGRFYPACAPKCQTILGFLLCGLGPG